MALHVDRHRASRPTSASEPLLLLHGLGGDRHSWRPVLDDLRRDRDVLVAELPGFGASPPLPETVAPTPPALATAVAAMLDHEGLDRVHVVGVSLGGWTALELALLGRAHSVVALAPAGFWSKPLAPASGSTRRVGRTLGPLLSPLLRVPPLRVQVLGGILGGLDRIEHRDALALIRGYLGAPDFARVDAAMRANVFDRSRLAGLAEALPVHLVWCGRDRLVTPPRAPLPEAVHQHHLPDAGHLPMFDEPESIVAHVRAAVGAAEDGLLTAALGD